jgi:NAD(P)-dependent dehydrogenase (short-subunit alcohol dehydrogenase family)
MAGLRRHLVEQARAQGKRPLPAEIEEAVSRILKDRRIRATLEACTAAGAMVEYHSLDVCDAQRLGELIDDIYHRFGRIDGVIHGAGVIEDRLLVEKTSESFARVFTTKVSSALTLARRLRPESLKFMAFLGSVSARFGNPGQADYSAANEFLNKLADDLARRWPARVVCINWGPWNEGMVVDPLKDLRWAYARAGLDLIPVSSGTQACLNELRLGHSLITNERGATVSRRAGGVNPLIPYQGADAPRSPGCASEVLIAASIKRLIAMSQDRG